MSCDPQFDRDLGGDKDGPASYRHLDPACPECGGEGEHGQGCGWVAQGLLDRAFDRDDDRRGK